MKTRAELPAWERRQLIAESDAQRAELARQLRPLAYRLESVDTGLRSWQTVAPAIRLLLERSR
jgi:hypothetical protein